MTQTRCLRNGYYDSCKVGKYVFLVIACSYSLESGGKMSDSLALGGWVCWPNGWCSCNWPSQLFFHSPTADIHCCNWKCGKLFTRTRQQHCVARFILPVTRTPCLYLSLCTVLELKGPCASYWWTLDSQFLQIISGVPSVPQASFERIISCVYLCAVLLLSWLRYKFISKSCWIFSSFFIMLYFLCQPL